LSAPLNLSIDFTDHSSDDSDPLPFVSSYANAFRLGPSSSSRSMRPSLSLSEREKRSSSRLFAVASGGAGRFRESKRVDAVRAGGAEGSEGASLARLLPKQECSGEQQETDRSPARNAPSNSPLQREIRRGGDCRLRSLLPKVVK
jgi:hypothetical protein